MVFLISESELESESEPFSSTTATVVTMKKKSIASSKRRSSMSQIGQSLLYQAMTGDNKKLSFLVNPAAKGSILPNNDSMLQDSPGFDSTRDSTNDSTNIFTPSMQVNTKEVLHKGMLGKFARARKRHTIQTKGIKIHNKNWKKRYFVLRGNTLEYYKNEKAFLGGKARKGGISLINCDHIPRYQGNEIIGNKYMFELRREVDGCQSCLLKMFASSIEERDDWISAIHQCVQNLGEDSMNQSILEQYQKFKKV
jgi:hypothetical protein